MMTINERDFTIILASQPHHESLTAEIFFLDKFVALVSQERGTKCMELETPGIDLEERMICRKFDLVGFLEAVKSAQALLRGSSTNQN